MRITGAAAALAAGLMLASCSSSDATPVARPEASPAAVVAASPAAAATALPNRCHLQAKAAMTEALNRDGNLDSLPKLPDRSMGIAACKGLTSEQLDDIALKLQTELQPYLLGAAARQATPS